MAQEAAPHEVANSEFRRLPARNKSPCCADVKVGDSALFYKAVNRKRTPRRRSLAKISDVDDAGATVKFQSQTFKGARYCARRKVEAQDVETAEGDPASAKSGTRDGVPGIEPRTEQKCAESALEGIGGNKVTSRGALGGNASGSPRKVTVPVSPSMKVRAPVSPSLSIRLPQQGPPLCRSYDPFQASKVDRARYDGLSSDQVRESRKRRGCGEDDSEEVWKTRPSWGGAAVEGRTATEGYVMDTSKTATGKRERAPVRG